MIGLRSAIGFLTILPVAPGVDRSDFVSARAWFPVVGLLLGAILGATELAMNFGFPVFSERPGSVPPLLSASVIVVALVVATRALHLDGFMDCCDGLLGGFSRSRRLEILKDPNVGAFAVIGVVCLLILKLSAVMALPASSRLPVLVIFPSISRWAVLVTMERFPYVREWGIGTPFMGLTGIARRILPTTATVLLTLMLTGLAGLLLVSVAGVVAVGIGAWSSKLLGGVTGDVYGAVIEIAEVSVLFSAVLLTHVFSADVFTSALVLLIW